MMRIVLKPREFIFLLGSSLIFFLLRFPSLFEPHWYGDEGIYQAIGYALNNGRELYSTIWDNKPPLLYLLYSIFNAEQFALRAISLLFGIASIIAFFFLAKKIYRSQKATFLSTSLFAILFSLPTFEGNIANAENFMLFFIILTGYFIIPHRVTEQAFPKKNHLFFSGILLGIAFLFKIVAIFDTASFILFLFLLHSPIIHSFSDILRLFEKKRLLHFIAKILPLLLGFISLFAAAMFYFLLNGTHGDFLHAVFARNVEYVGYKNTYFFPQGLLVTKLLLLLTSVVLFTWKKDTFSLTLRFILIWLGFSLFNAYFSQRPYTHYLLVLLPSFCLAVGLLTTLSKKARIKLAVLLFGIAFLLLNTFRYYSVRKTVGYYGNFISYIQGEKDLRAYRAFFDRRTPLYYDLASYLKNHVKENEEIFIWGDAPQIYLLSHTIPVGRYTVAYHILSSSDNTEEAFTSINNRPPRFLVVLHDAPVMPFFWTFYQPKVTIEGATIYERTL